MSGFERLQGRGEPREELADIRLEGSEE